MKNIKLHFKLLIRSWKIFNFTSVTNSAVKLLFFRFRVTNSRLKTDKFRFGLLTRWEHFYFLTSYVREVDKWRKFLKYYSFKTTWTVSFYYVFFVFSLLCCKYIGDIYLSMVDFIGFCNFNNIFIYQITENIQWLWAKGGMATCRSI